MVVRLFINILRIFQKISWKIWNLVLKYLRWNSITKGKEEFYMNKKICVSIIIALIMIVTLATSVLAANEDVTLVKVKDNVCTIKLGEDGEDYKTTYLCR